MSEIKSNHTYLQASIRLGFKIISHVFFREVKVTDIENVPKEGPCIFIVGPHANQFLDGIVFYSINPLHSYSLMADVSYRKFFIGHVAKFLNSIPVVRPQDIVAPGTGKINYDPLTNPYQIQGEGTRFLSELDVCDSIMFGKNYKGSISKILSDTLLEIRYPIRFVEGDVAYESAPFKIAPYVDQTPMYSGTFSYLNNNESISLFPEGGSHDRPEMLPLKAGFAIMALGATAANPALDIKIVPVGLNYFHREKFRSRAVVCYGPSLTLDPADVEKYRTGGKAKHEAIQNVLDQCDEALKSITLNAPDFDTLMVVQTIRALYVSTTKKKMTIEQVVNLNRSFLSLLDKLKDSSELKLLIERVKSYNQKLMYLGIKDYQVEKSNITPLKATVHLIKRVTKIIVMAGLGAPALILNFPLIWLTSHICQKMQKLSLKGSSVKIEGKDVIASWKVIVVTFAAPALYAFYSILYYFYMVRYQPHLETKGRRAILSWFIQPILHYLLMRLGDTGMDIYRSIKPLFLAIQNPKASENLRTVRKHLANDIAFFVKKNAPELTVDGNIKLLDSDEANSSSEEGTLRYGKEHIVLDDSSEDELLTEKPKSMTRKSHVPLARGEVVIDESSEEELEESTFNYESVVLEEDEEEDPKLSKI